MNEGVARRLLRRAFANDGSVEIEDPDERATARSLAKRGHLAVFFGRTLTLTDQGHDYCRFAGWKKAEAEAQKPLKPP